MTQLKISSLPVIGLAGDHEWSDAKNCWLNYGLQVRHRVIGHRRSPYWIGVACGWLAALYVLEPPFIVLEGDARIVSGREADLHKLTIPAEASLAYLGTSPWGDKKENPNGSYGHVQVDPIDSNWARVTGMLASHPVAVCSKSARDALIECCLSCIRESTPFDVFLAHWSDQRQDVFAMGDPLFFQDCEQHRETTLTPLFTLNQRSSPS
jgi:hypothetical protein